jgi:hypothetical protein
MSGDTPHYKPPESTVKLCQANLNNVFDQTPKLATDGDFGQKTQDAMTAAFQRLRINGTVHAPGATDHSIAVCPAGRTNGRGRRRPRPNDSRRRADDGVEPATSGLGSRVDANDGRQRSTTTGGETRMAPPEAAVWPATQAVLGFTASSTFWR